MAEESILTDSINQSNSRAPIHVPFIYNDTNFDWLARNAYTEEEDTGTGPFCKVYKDETHWKLTGGTVTGGSGNVIVADITLGSISSVPANGTYSWLVCSGNAVAEDGVLLPGFTLSTATVASGTSIPSNTMPTAASTSGVLRISLGSWSNGAFVPAGCGNIQIFHCPGTLSHVRG